MLELTPRSWLAWDFDIAENGSIVARLDMSSWRERGEVAIHEMTYRLYRDGMAGPFLLEGNGDIVASATKESVLRSSFVVEGAGHVYSLKKQSLFTRTFLLVEDGIEVGSMKAVSVLSRRGQARFPEKLPLAVRVFLVWLVIIIWQREQSSG